MCYKITKGSVHINAFIYFASFFAAERLCYIQLPTE